MIRADVLQQFPGLFGKKTVNGRELDVYDTIARLSREIDPAIATALAERRAVLADPAPVVKISALGASSVDFVVRPWANTADYWDVFFDLNKQLKQRADQDGISIPFPQRDVHIYEEKVNR